MKTLQFADTHNLAAFLAKPAKSDGFKQIVDFLNVHTIMYALTLQALVDMKKIVVTEASVRRDLQLDDKEGKDFLPNATIFEEHTRMGMVKNLDNASKFLMYPWFIQVFLDNQLEGMSSHKWIYVTPSHTKKIFANMRRQGKDFSGKETPLFSSIVVHNQEEIGKGSAMPTDPHHTPIITQPSSSQPQKKHKSRRPKEKDTQVPQSSVPSDPINVADEAVNEEPSMQLKELMDFVPNYNKECLTWRTQRLLKIRRLQGRKIDNIDADEDITLKNVHDAEMFDVNDLHGDKVFIEKEVPVKEVVSVAEEIVNAAIIIEDEITLAQALA
ncbi:hypothetical protein Tco_0956774 [Tanacetum coccineum]